MNVGILGLGEVGGAIKKLTKKIHKVFVRELTFDEIGDKKLDILHVCIPYNSKFEKIVSSLIKSSNPDLVIINSTVKPGTSLSLHKKTGANIVHAPIDGVHPNLYEYLFKFTKPLGAVNDTAYKLAKKHFTQLGVKTTKFDSPLETELAKILSTTYYGWNIIFEKYVHDLSETHNANFDQIYTDYNHIYNKGYKKSHPHAIRPILAHHDGQIGGHCVIPNAKILQDMLSDDFTKFLLEQNKKLK